MSERPRRAHLPTLVVALAFLVAPFAIYPQFVSDDAFLYGFDSGQSHLARFRILAHALQEEGRLPLWQVGSYGGGPFHANPENPTLYPPALLAAALFPPLLAMNLVVLAHFGVAATGMFLLVRRLWARVSEPDGDEDAGASPALRDAAGFAGAVVAGALFGFNHYTRLEGFNLVTYGATHALVPWTLLAADALLHGRSPRRAAGCLALALALLVTSGGHYAFAYAGLGLAVWVLVDGLLGGAEPRRRAVRWLPIVGLLTALVLGAKVLPFLEWVDTTNRAGALEAEVAEGVTLAGQDGAFDWTVVHNRVSTRSSGYLVLLGAPLVLLLRRRRVGWLALGLGAFGVAASLGLLHEPLLAHVPPFDRIRGAKRAWTLANAFLPLATGLGVAALVARLPARVALPAGRWGGPALALVLLPFLLDTDRFQRELDEPYSYAEVVGWHRQWPRAVEAAGDAGRVVALEVGTLGTRNEQFIAGALGAEALAGFFGYAYPEVVARHAYDNEGPLQEHVRLKRLRVASVVRTVLDDRPRPPRRSTSRHAEPFPPGVDGTTQRPLHLPRPRAFVPARTIAIVGDERERVLHALYDRGEHRPEVTALLSLDRAEVAALPEDARAAVDAWVLVGGGALSPPLEVSAGTPLVSVELPLDDVERELLAELAADVARGADASPDDAASFRRVDTHAVELARREATAGGWLVVSELWALHGGWVLDGTRADEAASRGAGGTPAGSVRLDARRADAVASAVWCPPGVAAVRARYAPSSARTGFVLACAGAAVALLLAVIPVRRDRAGR